MRGGILAREEPTLYSLRPMQLQKNDKWTKKNTNSKSRNQTRHTNTDRTKEADLRGEGGSGGGEEGLAIGKVDGGGHAAQHLVGLVPCRLEALRDDGGVDALVEEVQAGAQERARNDNNTGGAIAGLDVLRVGKLDKLGGGEVRMIFYYIWRKWWWRGVVENQFGCETIFAQGCVTDICFKRVAPSFEIMTSPFAH